MPRRIYITAALAVAFIVAPVSADWDLGDDHKMHHPQLPDLTPEGMDVLASLTTDPTGGQYPVTKVLADDFRCTETGLITDIHLWGSWLNDLFQPEPDHGTFILGIYSDIPAGQVAPWSQPGELLWNMKFKPGEYAVHPVATGPELFYDPNLNEIIGQDNTAWQYNFYIDEPLAPQQERDQIYWLSVMNLDPDNSGFVDISDLSSLMAGENRFGWKTSRDNWNDDAVFIDLLDIWNLPVDAIVPPNAPPGAVLPWQEMRYPVGHPFADESIDLAFVITPEPATLALLTLGTLAVLRRR